MLGVGRRQRREARLADAPPPAYFCFIGDSSGEAWRLQRLLGAGLSLPRGPKPCLAPGGRQFPLSLCGGKGGCGLHAAGLPPAEGAGAPGRCQSCPPLRASPLPAAGFVPSDVGMLEKEEEEEEGKGVRLPPPPVGDSPLAGAQGRLGGAEEKFAAAPSPRGTGAGPHCGRRRCYPAGSLPRRPAGRAAWSPKRGGGGQWAVSWLCWRPPGSSASAPQVRSGKPAGGEDATAFREGSCG